MEAEDKQTVETPEQSVQQPDVNADATGQAVETETVAPPQADGTAVEEKPYKGFAGKLDKFFGIRKAKTTFRAEIVGGLVTFMAMVYILMVNAGMFADPFGTGANVLGVSYGAIYIATALSAIVGTMLMSLLARLPMAQASGMGLNAFFVFTICVGFGLSYANALVLVLIDGVVFILLTVTGLRKILFNAIPKVVRVAIPAGIGLFIAFIDFKTQGLSSPTARRLSSSLLSTSLPTLLTDRLCR